MVIFLVRPTWCSISLTFQWKFPAVVFVRPLGSSPKGLYVLLPCCLSVFFGVGSLSLSKFLHGARNHIQVVRDKARHFIKTFICHKNLGNRPKTGQKIFSFLNLKKHLVFIFHWIGSIMKVYIICCVPAQIVYLEKKILFLIWDISWSAFSQSNWWNFCMLIKIHIN